MNYSGHESVFMGSEGAVEVQLNPLIQAFLEDFGLKNRIG